MFCAPIPFLHYFKEYKTGGLFSSPSEITGGGKTPACVMLLKYYENVIAAQNMPI